MRIHIGRYKNYIWVYRGRGQQYMYKNPTGIGVYNIKNI